MNETVDFERQYEGEDVIEVGDLVVVKAACKIISEFMETSRNAGAIFRAKLVMRHGRIAVQFQHPDGYLAWESFNPDELELVDVDALTIAEQSESLPFATLIADNPQRYGWLKDYQHVAPHGEMTVQQMAKDIESLLARNRLLEERLTPFALAALDNYIKNAPDASALIPTWTETWISLGEADYLRVQHLNDALEVLPELKPGSANAGGGSQ